MTAAGRTTADAGVRLARLVRYPVKGFGGQDLDGAVVRPGQGLPHDRAFAITNGTAPVEPAGAWTPPAAFVRLTRNPDLPRYRLHPGEAPADRPSLHGPDGRRLPVGPVGDGDDPSGVEEVLRAWFPPGPLGPPRWVTARQGLWDHRDATLSILNPATVHQLGRAAGRVLDPLRFRANLHLSGLPAWQELSLVGRRVGLGEVELEVLRPTDRCRATSVDPGDATTDLNVPALLAARCGHLYCGVYARVVRGGRLAPGQRLVDLGPAPAAVRDGAAVATAPPPARWPRPARVVRRVRESPAVTSYWLADPLADLRPAPRPGQHVRVHAADHDGPFWRAYTVSGVDGDLVRISVKHAGAQARMPGLLHRTASVGTAVVLTGPFGDAAVDPDPGPGAGGPLLLATAGIGLTPAVAVLRALVARGGTRPVVVLHVARDGDDLALWPEALALLAALPAARARLFLTRPTPRDPAAAGARRGRPRRTDLAELVEGLDPGGLTAHLCGPVAFTRDLRRHLLDLGAPAARLYTEVFRSPTPGAGTGAPPPRPGPFRVTFTAGAAETTWTTGSGSLLDVAEAAGLSPPAGCRAGACGSCARTLLAGTTAYTTEPVLAPPPPQVLLCCAVPTTDVRVQA